METPTELRTGRLLLRPHTLDDAADVFEFARDPEWGGYLVNVPQPFTEKDAVEFVTRFSDFSAWDTTPMFAVVLEARVIGQVYLNLDSQNERAELGYSLSRKHWGKGLATEAARVVMNWGFWTHSLNKVCATCDPRNERSRRVLEKLGMAKETLLRRHLKWQGEFRHVLHYGILRSEWEAA